MPAKPSKVVWWPAIVAAAVPAVLIGADAALGDDFLWALIGFPFVMLLMAVASVGAAVVGILAFVNGARRRALSAGVLPAMTVLIACFPFRFFHVCHDAGERLSFEVHEATYRRSVDALQTSGEFSADPIRGHFYMARFGCY